MRISICCPSYKRPKVETLEHYPHTRVYVSESEKAEYMAANHEGADIVAVPDAVQGNVARIRNYILEREFEGGADCVVIIDDDLQGIFRWNARGDFGYETKKLTEPELFELCRVGSHMCEEWGYRLWGLNCGKNDKKAFKQCTPFNTLGFIGGPFSAHLRNPIRYDERLPLKEDYDLTLQHLNKYRGALRFNMYFYMCRQSENTGGCAQMRNIARERQQFEALQAKWGENIVRSDNTSKKQFDYNPIIKVPIAGV